MKDLMSSTSATMTLKEITDLIEVRHNNAMVTVETMATGPEFGELLKISSSYINNLGASIPIETYQLDKRQSIAVASRLNTALLMRVIDRWLELEGKPLTTMQMVVATAQAAVEQERANALTDTRLKAVEAKQQVIDRVVNEFTVMAYFIYAELGPCDLSAANALGRKTAKLCREHGYPIGKQPDPRFGQVNSYPEHALIEVLREEGYIPQ